ncbi:MAG: hypothetical protein JWP27_1545 [Flaviaesturariibacter sp.]|nr:hypothetical protein [Flaviaesturariibacter sp.]
MNRSLYKTLACSVCAVALFGSACQLLWNPGSPRDYLMRRPQKMILEKKLNEISGIFYLASENKLLAIADDKKKIYALTLDGKVSDYYDPELPSADFEDVVKVDSTVYTLISNGTVVAIQPSDSGLVSTSYPFWSTDKNDFETLYYDSTAKGLVILCKSCAFEKGKHQRTAFRFDPKTRTFDRTPLFTISSQSVRDVLKDGKVEFNPSALAIHPFEKRLYILASSGNLLVITDLRGKVQEAYRLNPTLYPQPEGIAFATNGDMYVSNEAKLGKPTLLRIPYKHHPTK